jgi:arylsulfatase A-like enzyme
MKVIYAMFDTLNRRSLECYGGTAVKTPNFNRLADRAVTFDNHYVGSLPCMPARREMMTGRHNFLHRSWGPCEPFDHAFPEILAAKESVYSHLVTDHAHYWKDGGATYHTRYDSCELIRGQEMDSWKGIVDPPADWQERYHSMQFNIERRNKYRRSMTNREYTRQYEDYPAVQTISLGLEFIDCNRDADDWFLQIETFDPHEPFDVPVCFREGYPTDYHGPVLDFPSYGYATDDADEVAELRANYAATLAHCDYQLGRLLDKFDELDLWRDTALVVSTDHGFLLGEQELWGKLVMPVFNEVAHIPLFIYHPDFAGRAGARQTALTQTTDLMPTFLEMFKSEPPQEVLGHSLLPLVGGDGEIHDAILYGQHGCAINITDGRYTYMRYPKDIHGGHLNQYTLMPTHIVSLFTVEELRNATLAPPFDFTQGVPLLKVPAIPTSPAYLRHGAGVQILTGTRLFDLENDPQQQQPIDDPEVETRLLKRLVELMMTNDAPKELYTRFDLTAFLPAGFT